MNVISSDHVPPGFENELNNIAIDFDGVIHNFDKGWHDGTCYGEPLPGSLEAIKFLSKKYNIIIFTAKAKSNRPLVNGKTGIELVEEWLKKYNIMQYVKEITSDKPRAKIYIDDNGYRFNDWDKALKDLEEIL
mgnify:CR=1 FL=1|jgi:hypothetical protein|tara:strand:- start:892 stop:1290 length:399 start_codon:yes stop_codon:yes gene_type:complete